jgi:serine/threonine protein phosphatase PrpC
MKPEDAILYVERDLDAVERHPFCAGTAVVYTRRAPAKEGGNQDAAGLVPYGGESGVVIVADGLGGARGGAQAASTALHEMTATLEQGLEAEKSLREAILDGIENANREVSAMAIGAGTTLAVAEIRGNRLRPYHVGDSEILVVGQKGKVKLHTVSHSPTGYAVESGLMDEEEARVHEERHFVFNVIGRPEMRIEMGAEIELSARDTLLVACDGLFDNLATEEIVDLLRRGTLEEAAAALVATCSQRMTRPATEGPSKPDDLTLVAFRRE